MFQIFNFLRRQRTEKHQATFEGYLPYFEDDKFPLKWHKAISESPSATACVSTISDFLEGFGFSDSTLEKRIVNTSGETLFQIHKKISQSFAEFEGFYIHFMYNAGGKITQMRVLPFESCRLGDADNNGIISTIYYNPFFGIDDKRAYTKGDITVYSAFDLPAVRAQIKKEGPKYKGQVLFVGTTTALSRFYPYPEAASAMPWMRSEAGIAEYHEQNINNGMHQPYILVMKGNPSDPSTNPEYTGSTKPTTIAEEFQEVVSHNFMGSKRVGNLMVQWVNIAQGEETPEVIPLPSNASGDLFVTIDNQATKKITVAFKVPGVLANIQEGVSLGGDGNQIRVAVKLMQQRVIKKQRVLTDTYEMILRNSQDPYTDPITIVPYNPYPELEVIDDKIWNSMTEEERRKWINDNTEIELIEEAQVEAPNQPEPTTANSFKNLVPTGFPDNIRNLVKKALEFDEATGMKCSRPGGRDVAQKIIDNQNMGLRQLKRIYSYVKKRQELANSTFDSCDSIMYHQWGGKAMEQFLEAKIKDIEAWLN